jgi:hypothetical protein
MSTEVFAPAAYRAAFPNLDSLLADLCRQPSHANVPPVVRVSRVEAILADVFEKGMPAMAPLVLAGRVLQ